MYDYEIIEESNLVIAIAKGSIDLNSILGMISYVHEHAHHFKSILFLLDNTDAVLNLNPNIEAVEIFKVRSQVVEFLSEYESIKQAVVNLNEKNKGIDDFYSGIVESVPNYKFKAFEKREEAMNWLLE